MRDQNLQDQTDQVNLKVVKRKRRSLSTHPEHLITQAILARVFPRI